jgi:hypothetical protein
MKNETQTEQLLTAINDIFGNNSPKEQPKIDFEELMKIQADTYRNIMNLNESK